MNDSGWTYIQLNSGDLSIRSFDTSQSFQNTLANPIILEGDRDYEVWLVVNFITVSHCLQAVIFNQWEALTVLH